MFAVVSQADNPYEKTRGFMLCDAVGMGKTSIALAIFVKDFKDVGQVRPTVIMCPSGLKYDVWKVRLVRESSASLLHTSTEPYVFLISQTEMEKHMPDLLKLCAFVGKAEDWDECKDGTKLVSR